jgi:hypothetical protein
VTQRSKLHGLRALALGAALLFAQWLGLAHGVLHAHAPNASSSSATWFGDHDEPDCRLFDQAAHGDLHVAGFGAPPPETPTPPRAEVHRAWRFAQQAAGPFARGPPRIG